MLPKYHSWVAMCHTAEIPLTSGYTSCCWNITDKWLCVILLKYHWHMAMCHTTEIPQTGGYVSHCWNTRVTDMWLFSVLNVPTGWQDPWEEWLRVFGSDILPGDHVSACIVPLPSAAGQTRGTTLHGKHHRMSARHEDINRRQLAVSVSRTLKYHNWLLFVYMYLFCLWLCNQIALSEPYALLRRNKFINSWNSTFI